jgi:hypothetical protein
VTVAAWPWKVLFLSVKGSALIMDGHSAFESSRSKDLNLLGISSAIGGTVSS